MPMSAATRSEENGKVLQSLGAPTYRSSDAAYALACEVYSESGRTDSTCEAVIERRWPARGPGGVAHAQRRTANEVRVALVELVRDMRAAGRFS